MIWMKGRGERGRMGKIVLLCRWGGLLYAELGDSLLGALIIWFWNLDRLKPGVFEHL